jgi:acetyltransferase-like isoleucine patch superfamily enzyme
MRTKPEKKGTSRFKGALFQLPAMLGPFSKMRVFFHRLRGVHIGEDVEIGYLVLIDNLYPENVFIEDGAGIGARSTILSHDAANRWLGIGPDSVGKTVIRERAMVGVHCIILHGVTVGKGAIVGAGSVVTKDVPDDAVVAGVPAKRLK